MLSKLRLKILQNRIQRFKRGAEWKFSASCINQKKPPNICEVYRTVDGYFQGKQRGVPYVWVWQMNAQKNNKSK